MKRIIIISLLSSLQLFCGSDEETPLMREVENYSEKQQILSKQFYNAVYSNDARFFQINLKKLRPQKDVDWIALTSAADAQIFSTQELVKSAAQAKFFRKQKLYAASIALGKALSIRRLIEQEAQKKLEAQKLQQKVQVARSVELLSKEPQDTFEQVPLN
jgi:hypothetical protein